MFGDTWLAYFEKNAHPVRPPSTALAAEVPEALRPALIRSLGRFQLGESAGGRIHEEIASHADAALDPPTRRSIKLYIEEEWRHARELALLIDALGGKLQTEHWTNSAFTATRRLLGLRTKLLTLAVAEVIGIVYYRALASGVGSRALAQSLRAIADEEARHLDFQAAFFDHAVERTHPLVRDSYRRMLSVELRTIFSAATLVFFWDHGKLLGAIGAKQTAVLAACRRELRARRFLEKTARIGALPRSARNADVDPARAVCACRTDALASPSS